MKNDCSEPDSPGMIERPGASAAPRDQTPALAGSKPAPSGQKPSLPDWIAGLAQLPPRC